LRRNGASDTLFVMGKSVADLTAEELDKLAGEAWSDAAKRALAAGLSVTGSSDGRRFRQHPDGRMEDLGPVAPLRDEGHPKKKHRNSAA
jgi:hypothetical protein